MDAVSFHAASSNESFVLRITMCCTKTKELEEVSKRINKKKKKGLMYREMEVLISVLHLTPLSPSSSI